jgi:hypothetical protein
MVDYDASPGYSLQAGRLAELIEWVKQSGKE